MRLLLPRTRGPCRRRHTLRRTVFSAQFAGGDTTPPRHKCAQVYCDVLERRIVLASSQSDFIFSHGTITGYTGAGGEIRIPSSIGGVPVTTIGDNAFQDNTLITSVVIPSSVVTVGSFAFSHNTSLTTVRIGNGVERIGDHAFDAAFALTSLTIGTRVTSIGDYAFAVSAIKTVTIPNSVTAIGNGAFEVCASLRSVSIPNSVISIGNYAFKNTGVRIVSIGNSVASIGDYAFFNCNALKTATVGTGVTSIGTGAFQDAVRLTSLTFTANAPTVGADAFKNVPFGAKAVRDAALSGYGGNGDLWNGLIVWRPGPVVPPMVFASMAPLAQDAGTITIKGTGFVPGKPSAHRVIFSNNATGTVTASTSTRLTVVFSTTPNSLGPLTAIVTSVGGTSGMEKRVAKIVAAPS